MIDESSSGCERGWAKRLCCILLLLSAAFFMATTCCLEAAQEESEVLELRVDGRLIDAEAAATPEVRDIGLANRLSLPFDHGMLFVFPEARRHCMWMHNTHISHRPASRQ